MRIEFNLVRFKKFVHIFRRCFLIFYYPNENFYKLFEWKSHTLSLRIRSTVTVYSMKLFTAGQVRSTRFCTYCQDQDPFVFLFSLFSSAIFNDVVRLASEHREHPFLYAFHWKIFVDHILSSSPVHLRIREEVPPTVSYVVRHSFSFYLPLKVSEKFFPRFAV